MYGDFKAISKTITVNLKTAKGTFVATFGNIWDTFDVNIWSH